MEDTRNWKCFFGMHQWQVIEKVNTRHFEESTSARPYKITMLLRMKCVHCGKHESQRID